MRYGEPLDRRGARPAARRRVHAHSRRPALSAIRGEHDRLGRRRRRGLDDASATRSGAAQSSTRSTTIPATSARWPPPCNDYWTAARAARAPRAVLPRRAAPDAASAAIPIIAIARRRRACLRANSGSSDRSGRSRSSRASAADGGSSRTRRTCWPRSARQKLRRVDVFCPRLRSRLPRNARGARHRGQADVSGGRRRATTTSSPA